MREFRITFPDRYPPTSAGHSDPSARQGYYVKASDSRAAWDTMHRRFPFERIEVQLWSN